MFPVHISSDVVTPESIARESSLWLFILLGQLIVNCDITFNFQLFQKILAEIDKKIADLKVNLFTRMKTMPINVQEQTKYIR